MLELTRRDFLKTSAAALTLATNARLLHASPFNLPIGIQLYSVREDLAKKFETLRGTDPVAALKFLVLNFENSGIARE